MTGTERPRRAKLLDPSALCPSSLKKAAYGALDRVQKLLALQRRRFEFERLYSGGQDPWKYLASDYEHTKYRRTLDLILARYPSPPSALELGCSIGVFTRMLAEHAHEVVAVDISYEALRQAKFNCPLSNVRFTRADVLDLNLSNSFDLIICAEILYYLNAEHADRICQTFERLKDKGAIVLVTDDPQFPAIGYDYGWTMALQNRFKVEEHVHVDDPFRPYDIFVFSRPTSLPDGTG